MLEGRCLVVEKNNSIKIPNFVLFVGVLCNVSSCSALKQFVPTTIFTNFDSKISCMDNNNTYNNTYNNKNYINQATIPRFMEKSSESDCSHVYEILLIIVCILSVIFGGNAYAY
jgi:hypothetical protein